MEEKNIFKITDSVYPLADEVKIGDQVELAKQTCEVVACQETGVKMLNIDADQLAPGDLRFIKKIGLTISNPETEEPIALGVELKKKETFGQRLSKWFEENTDDDDDDSSFFSSSPSSSGSLFGGGSSFGGFGGGFGGFGGGGFGGGGASRGF